MDTLYTTLLELRDPTYQKFLQRLIPNLPPETILGIRTPQLRRLAKEMPASQRELFLRTLPHVSFEENQLHAFLLEGERDFHTAIAMVEAFLPWVDNWATCDQLRPKVFGKYRFALLESIRRWLDSCHPYTVRFAIEMLMVYFLEDEFDMQYLEWVAQVHHEDYYVRMMVAWYFATALAKQYDDVLPYIQNFRLEKWIHNKCIQKAVESYRITPEQKAILRTFRLK